MQVKPQKIDQKDAAEAFDFLRRIDFILKTIREEKKGIVSEMTEEEKKNLKTIIRVEFPKEGGVLSYFEGIELPVKGFPYGESVETVDNVKKVLMITLKGIEEALIEGKIKTLLSLIIFRKQIFKIGSALLSALNRNLRDVRSKPEMYCPAVQEMYRAFGSLIEREKDGAMEKNLVNFRDISCMALEYDDAYRYPFQNVIIELNKEAVSKDVVKEIGRLLDLAIEWEAGLGTGRETRFRRLKRFLFIVRFNKKLREMLKRFLYELDLSKVAMDETDKFHARLKGIKINEKKEKEEKQISS